MRKKERLMGLIMAVVMSTAMGILAAFLVLQSNPQAAGGKPPVITYLINIALSVTVGIVVALVVPLGKIGKTLTMKANAAPPSLKFNLINSIPMAVGNTLIVSIVVSTLTQACCHPFPAIFLSLLQPHCPLFYLRLLPPSSCIQKQ